MLTINETLLLKTLSENNFNTFEDLSNFFKKNYGRSLNESFSFNKSLTDKIKKFKTMNRGYEIKLAENGIDIKKIKKMLSINANNSVNKIKKLSLNDKVKVSKIIQDNLIETKKTIIDNITNYFVDSIDIDNYTLSDVVLIVILFSFSFLINSILVLMLGELAGTVIGAVFICPIFEEIAKLTAIKVDNKKGRTNRGYIFLILFNIGEFTIFLNGLLKMGVPISRILINRTPAFIFHIVDHIFLNAGFKNDIEQGKSEEVAGGTTTLILIIIHSIFNVLALISSKI
jgi:hypothetical protein